jgi:hypothetical protein
MVIMWVRVYACQLPCWCRPFSVRLSEGCQGGCDKQRSPGWNIDPAGTIGRHVLARPLLERRLRISPRIVKRAISKYQAPRIDRTSYKATTSIATLAPPAPLTDTTQPQTERP